MTKEELKQEAEEYFKSICGDYNEEYERTGKRHYFVGYDIKDAYLASAEPREKRISELEEKISILLSCKNCPENKGGYICEKEYENKCLAQKIQYIKELQEENAELKSQIEKMKCCSNCKNCRRKFIKKNVFENTCKVEHCRNYDKWEIKEK